MLLTESPVYFEHWADSRQSRGASLSIKIAMRRRSFRGFPGLCWIVLLWFVLFSFGCTTSAVNYRSDRSLNISRTWAFEGKMAIRSEQGNAHFQIHWQQQADDYDIHLLGPFGQSVAHIHGQGDALILDVPRQSKRVNRPDIEAVKESLGWDLPVKEMSFWVTGLPAPDLAREIAYDKQGLAARLEQSGWRVEYQQFKQQIPVRTTFTKDSVEILLVIKAWHFDDA